MEEVPSSSKTAEVTSADDAEVLNMVGMAEKAVVVLAMHLNDSCDGSLDIERAKMVLMALSNVISFIQSASTEQKVAFISGLLTKVLTLEGLGAYFMRHWAGNSISQELYTPLINCIFRSEALF